MGTLTPSLDSRLIADYEQRRALPLRFDPPQITIRFTNDQQLLLDLLVEWSRSRKRAADMQALTVLTRDL